jgi:integrase
MRLTDKDVARLPVPPAGWYLVRDEELKGLFVVVGQRTKTYTVQGDLRKGGKRRSIRVVVGEAGDITARDARVSARQYLSQIAKGVHPKPKVFDALVPTVDMTTLRSAWARYRDAHLVRKGRSDKTLKGYRDHVERLFADWLDRPMAELGSDPKLVVAMHDRLTATCGPYIANGSMRTLRAIYNHARKSDRSLPSDNPAYAIDWNPENRRDTALGLADLPAWFDQLAALANPVRREFHLMMLLSGCRPDALKQVRLEHIDAGKRILHIPIPKGGARKAFDIPLSHEMIRSLVRVRRAGLQMYPGAAETFLFPADSGTGHIAEQKEDRNILSKWGNDLRQSYRTLAQAAGVSEVDARLLMNHALPGVNAGYITRHKLLEDHLRGQQEAISNLIMRPARAAAQKPGPIAEWLGPRYRQFPSTSEPG